MFFMTTPGQAKVDFLHWTPLHKSKLEMRRDRVVYPKKLLILSSFIKKYKKIYVVWLENMENCMIWLIFFFSLNIFLKILLKKIQTQT